MVMLCITLAHTATVDFLYQLQLQLQKNCKLENHTPCNDIKNKSDFAVYKLAMAVATDFLWKIYLLK